MSDGGKGDRNRVENLKAWRENYEKIFGNRDLPNQKEEEPDVLFDEIVDFLKNIDSEEYPVQRGQELYKKYLTES